MPTIHSPVAKRPALPTLPTTHSLRAHSERRGIFVALNRFAVRCRSAVFADQFPSSRRSGRSGILAAMTRFAVLAILVLPFLPLTAQAQLTPCIADGPNLTFEDHVDFINTNDGRSLTVGTEIPPLTLPQGCGGIDPWTYSLKGAPAGLSFNPDADNRMLTGTPTMATAASPLTYTVTDSEDTTASLTFSIAVNPVALSFSQTNIDPQNYTVGTEIATLTLPEAAGGTGTLTYTLTGEPDGLTFNSDPAVRTLAGTPTATASSLIYTVTDSGDSAFKQTESLTFSITVNPTLRLSDYDAPSPYTVDAPITLTLPAASGGTPTLSYTLTGQPNELTFNSNTRTLVGTPTTVTTSQLTYTVTDSGSPPQTDSLTFSLTVDPVALILPNYDDPSPYTVDAPITLTLPAASGGTPTLSYTLTGQPNELTFNSNTRTLVGTPTTATASQLTYTVTDSGMPPQTDSLTFSITVLNPSSVHELEELNEQILSRTSQAMTASVSARVVARVEAAGNGNDGTGDPSAVAYQFGGYSSMHDLLQSHGKAMLEGEMEVAQLLDGASFVLPLSAAEGDSAGGIGGKLGALSLWGGSNLTQMDGDSNNLDWDGDMSSFHLGVDAPVGNNMLAGLALSMNQASFDYNDNGQSGDYEYASTNLHPYFGYIHNDKLSLWGAAGLGEGEIEVDGDNANKLSTDTTHTSLAGGFNNQLLRAAGLLPDSVTTLNVKSDVSFVQVDVDSANAQDARFTAQTVDSHHLRLLVSGEQRSELADGGALASSAEIGVRYDGGDGVTGAGVEVGTGLRYAKPDGGLTLSGNVRGLLLDDYDEWGADFTVRLMPQSGRGLSLSLQPIWGQTQRTTEQLWNEGGRELGDSDTALQSRMDSEVGYSIAAKMLGSTGVLTQYTGMTTADGGVSHVRLGSRFAGGSGLSLNLEGARENDGDGASNSVLLRGELEF